MNSSTDRKALLKEKTDRYIAEMEASGAGVNYNNVTTDRLLILEALNDWSGRLLAEGGDLKLTYECDDPACTTPYEMDALIGRMHAKPVLFYPVSGFSLADDDGLRFNHTSSSYRLMPHAGGSRTDAIGIAESSHIQDVDAAMNLWSLCATEDCLAYLKYQMAEHGLYFGDDELSATRQIIASALLTNFSISRSGRSGTRFGGPFGTRLRSAPARTTTLQRPQKRSRRRSTRCSLNTRAREGASPPTTAWRPFRWALS